MQVTVVGSAMLCFKTQTHLEVMTYGLAANTSNMLITFVTLQLINRLRKKFFFPSKWLWGKMQSLAL